MAKKVIEKVSKKTKEPVDDKDIIKQEEKAPVDNKSRSESKSTQSTDKNVVNTPEMVITPEEKLRGLSMFDLINLKTAVETLRLYYANQANMDARDIFSRISNKSDEEKKYMEYNVIYTEIIKELERRVGEIWG